MIYLDNAATTLHKPPQVVQAVCGAMTSLGNAARGAHSGALDASRVIYRMRAKLAALFGCPQADHVVFTCNATEALNTAINGLVRPGDRVVTTDWEHNSVLRPLYRLEKERGIRLDFVPADRQGRLDYAAFSRLLEDGADLVVCNHASNVTGDMMDLPEISRMAHAAGALFMVDASQTAGAIPIDMEGMGIDVLCFTGHKGLLGPQGTGGLCVRPGVEIAPWKAGGSGTDSFNPAQPDAMPTRLEAGTLNAHGLAGLSAAVDFLTETGLDTIHAREDGLARHFYEKVSEIEGVKLYGDFSQATRAPIVSLNIREYDSAVVSDELAQRYGIATRPGAHCAPRIHRALGTEEQGVVRFSFSYFNSEEDVDTAATAIAELADE